MIGQTLSHYEILEKLGSGGMGVVYLARDTKLDRDVAIKVLPEAFSQDKERLLRFEREAKLLASLNHPSIAAIHELAESDGIHFLALEYVPGETLAERIKRGSIPFDEALPLFKQIAEGLEAAHEKGVIHRDLKPANIKVTPEGKAKVLDFGLAKALSGDVPAQEQSESPTRTRNATEAGVLLGTAPYMSPEQARGKAVDRRTDIWAFGCCLYEALTGKTTFLGETVSDTIAAVLAKEPDWEQLPPNTPSSIHQLMQRCLRKDAKRRLHDMADVRIEIEEVSAEPPVISAIGKTAGARRRRAVSWILAALAAIVTGVAVWNFKPQPPRRQARFVINTPPDGPLRLTGSQTDIAISPDGTRIVYMTSSGSSESRQLYVRDLDELVATPLLDSERARSPFFSPDGEWVGFQVSGGSDTNNLKKVSVLGGRSVTICQWTSPLLGASWGSDDTIVFSTFASKGLLRVPAVGGEPEVLTTMDSERGEVDHRWPEILPSGNAILFTIVTNSQPENKIAVLSLETSEQKLLVPSGSNPHYSPTGHVVYGVDGTLWAVPFDLDALEVTGDPIPILENVVTKNSGAANFSFSRAGSLVYVSGTTASTTQSTLVLIDRSGRETLLTEMISDYLHPRFSPDGRHVAFAVAETEGSITDYRVDIGVRVIEVERGSRTRVLDVGNNNLLPTWSPDGSRVAFGAAKAGSKILYSAPVDGSGLPEELFVRDGNQFYTSWKSDGRAITFYEYGRDTGYDLWVLSLNGDPTPSPFLVGPFSERAGTFSPDGRFIAYVSNETGQDEVYVRPYPGPGGAVIVSTRGGTEPVWAPDGNELFYRNGNQMLVAQVETEGTFSARTATVLFEGSYEADRTNADANPNYDISPDGQHFVMVRRTGEGERVTTINIILNWFDELERLVPTH